MSDGIFVRKYDGEIVGTIDTDGIDDTDVGCIISESGVFGYNMIPAIVDPAVAPIITITININDNKVHLVFPTVHITRPQHLLPSSPPPPNVINPLLF
jgi:hypothetical protein